MDIREFPVLTDEDRELIDRLSAALGERAARTLAYLLRRFEDPSLEKTATATAVHIGTGLGKTTAKEGLAALERADLVAATRAETTTPGRPPKAWHAVRPRAEATWRAYDRHATELLRQADRLDERTGARSAPDGDRGGERDDESDVVVGLNWRSNGFHLPLFAARHADAGGLDAGGLDAGDLDVGFAVEEYDGSSAAVGAVEAGEVDVGVAGAATVLRERARGRSIVPIAVLFQRSAVVLYTTRAAFGGPFEGIDQLRGRRLGTVPGAETGLLGRLLLEQAGLRDDVEVVDLGGEERAALRSGEVDVATGVGPDPRRLERSGETVDVVPVADRYPVYGPALIARRDALHGDRSRLETVLAAVTAGWAEATHAPDAAVSEIGTRSNEPDEWIERTFSRAKDRFGTTDAVRKRGWGWHSADEWHSLRDALAQGGVLA